MHFALPQSSCSLCTLEEGVVQGKETKGQLLLEGSEEEWPCQQLGAPGRGERHHACSALEQAHGTALLPGAASYDQDVHGQGVRCSKCGLEATRLQGQNQMRTCMQKHLENREAMDKCGASITLIHLNLGNKTLTSCCDL